MKKDNTKTKINQKAGRNSVQIAGDNNYVVYNGERYKVKKIHFHQIPNYSPATIIVKSSPLASHSIDMLVQFGDLIQLEQPSDTFKQQLAKYECASDFDQWLKMYLSKNSGKHYSLMATSLENSCKANKDESVNENVKNVVHSYIKNGKGKQEFCVFLSAITLQRDGKYKTIEYRAASIIAKILKKHNIGVFWWEDSALCKEQWYISSKIATGLALSSVFVGLAFDSVKSSNNVVDYICFDSKKGSPCFKYEVETFKSFYDVNKHKDFVKGFVDNYDEDYPKGREMAIFSYGPPKNYEGCNRIFDNIDDKVIPVPFSDQQDTSEKVKTIVKVVVKKVLDIIVKINEKYQQDLCGKCDINTDNYEQWIDAELSSFECINDEVLQAEKMYLTDSSTPSNYLFRYSVIDEADGELVAFDDHRTDNNNSAWNHEKNKFLMFIDHYFENGKRKFRLNLVVRDWNQAFMEDLALRAEALGASQNKLSVNDQIFKNPLTELSKYTQFKVEGIHNDTVFKYNIGYTHIEENSEDGTCCAVLISDIDEYISRYEGIAQGKIIFSGLRKNLVDNNVVSQEKYPTEKVYNFAVIIYQRQVIKYYLKEKNRSKVVFKFNARLPENLDERHFTFYRDDDRIPCLMDDDAVRGVKFEFNAQRTILTVDIAQTEEKNTNETNKKEYTYRLRLENIDKYILLYDVEVEKRKEQTKHVGLLKLKCPYCAEELKRPSREDEKKGLLVKCDGTLKESWGNEKVKKICAHELVISKGSSDTMYLFALPPSYEKSNSVIVHMLGGKRSGKSVFISRLFSFVPNNLGVEHNLILECIDRVGSSGKDIQYDAVKPEMRYVKETSLFENVKFYQPKITESKNENFSDEHFRNIFLRDSLYSYINYSEEKYDDFVVPTEGGKDVSKIPFLFTIDSRYGKTSYISLFDIPGEEVQGVFDNDSIITDAAHKKQAILNSECIILLCNGQGAMGDANAESTIVDAIAQLQCYTRDIDKVRLKSVNIAVVLCKFDAFEHEFAKDSTVRSLAPISIRQYGRSTYEKYIDMCSDEIKSYLQAGSKGRDLVKEIENCGVAEGNYKFFAVSSIGHKSSVFHMSAQKNKLRFVAAPRGIDNVLAWLAYKTDIIV